jgi:hypothetical protein
MKIEGNKTLRLRLVHYPGIEHALRSLAAKEGRTESSMAVRLIGEALDARRLSEKQDKSPEFQMLLRLVAEAAKNGDVPACADVA